MERRKILRITTDGLGDEYCLNFDYTKFAQDMTVMIINRNIQNVNLTDFQFDAQKYFKRGIVNLNKFGKDTDVIETKLEKQDKSDLSCKKFADGKDEYKFIIDVEVNGRIYYFSADIGFDIYTFANGGKTKSAYRLAVILHNKRIKTKSEEQTEVKKRLNQTLTNKYNSKQLNNKEKELEELER